MTEPDILKKIAIAKAKPDTLTDLRPSELADLVLIVLEYVKKINSAIDAGKIKGEKGNPAPILQPDKDYLSLPTAKREIDAILAKAVDSIERDVKKALSRVKNGRDGKDAKVTREHIEEAARIALQLIQIPNFSTLITQEPEAIRNSLELLQGDERLTVKAISGIDELLAELERKIHFSQKGGGGGIRELKRLLDITNAETATTGYVLKKNADGSFSFAAESGGAGSVDWGDIGGALSDQTDLQDALDGKADALGADDNYVTDAEKVKLSNLSGINTGDQDLSPYFHKSNDDTDDINVGATNKFTTASDITKLAGIETAADVTDAGNVGSSIHGSSAKTTPVDADTMPLIDSAASNVLKKVTWANIKATLKTYFDTLYEGSLGFTPFDSADVIDEDDMASDSDTKVPTQQSVKAYVDSQIGGGGYTDEEAQDAVGGILTDSSEIDFTYNDATPSITASIKASSIDEAKLDASVNASLDLADSSLQSDDIGVSIQAYSANLDEYAAINPTAAGLALLDDANAAAQLVTLGLTATAAELNILDGATLDVTELNYLDGVTSAVQAQLDAKAPKASPTFTGTVTVPATNFTVGASLPFSDSAGTLTLQNVDALDATTESTIEAAIDTLANLTSIQGWTVTLADAGADAILGWDDSANAYENLTQAEVLAVIGSSSDTAQGVVELATAAETTTGTDATRAVTPDGLAGSDYGKRVVQIQVSDPNGSAITTGDGKAYFRVNSVLNGYNLVAVAAHVTTVSSSGIPTVQIANVTDSVDMLSTKLTIDANEKDSSTAATAAVIDGTHDDVATGDELRIDIDVAGTGAKGLIVELTFQLP